jgi:low affinity Fe/Cu permease
MIDYDRALLSPASVFKTPTDVLKEKSLSLRQKKEILNRWEHDARLLQTASDENMTGGESSNLAQVQEAQRAADTEEDELRHWGFEEISKVVAHWTGRPSAFWLAVILIVVWAVSGPIFGYSDAWQLTINTGTTIVTFLMVFLIQSTQNRDTAAIHVKLDELVRATSGATNVLLDLEDLTEEKIETFRRAYRIAAAEARRNGTVETAGAAPSAQPEPVAAAGGKGRKAS